MAISAFLDSLASVLVAFFAVLRPFPPSPPLAQTLSPSHRLLVSKHSVANTSERYFCVCVDLGQIAEPTRFWNPAGAKGKTLETTNRPSYDFGRIRLRNLAAELAPGYLRIGGTEADRVYYALNVTDGPADLPPVPFKSVMTAARMHAISDFASATDLDVVLAVNAGWGARTAAGAWDSTQARALFTYIHDKALPFRVFELGNEPNGYPFLQGGLTVSPESYARDLFALMEARDALLPDALVAAGSTAWFPSIGELPVPDFATGSWTHGYLRRMLVAASTLRLPDIVTWHYYPGQSDRAVSLSTFRTAALAAGGTAAALLLTWATQRRGARRTGCVLPGILMVGLLGVGVVGMGCAAVFEVVTPVTVEALRSPSTLDRARLWGAEVRAIAHGFDVPPKVWLGETGSAQAGGQPGVSGTFISALWWLDQLGSLAVLDHQVQCRQTLSGSDYGLIDDLTMRPTPDFWASVLFRRLMGTEVFAASVEGAPLTVRVYCHRSAASQEKQSCLVLNLGPELITMDLGTGSSSVWQLDAPPLSRDKASKFLFINGKEPRTLYQGQDDGKVPPIPGAPGPADGQLVLPSTSAIFVEF